MPAGRASDAVGLVLAAGAGTRFGAAKQVAQLGGRPLIQWPIDALRAGGVEHIVVVLGAHADAVRQALGAVESVVAADWAEGISASLRTGVAAAQARGADRVLVVLGDQPHLTGVAVARVLAASRRGAPFCRACYGGVCGHPVALGRETFAAIAALRGDAGARALTRWSPVDVDCAGAGAPADVDTPADLGAACALLAAGRALAPVPPRR